jgi:hypothetical protein
MSPVANPRVKFQDEEDDRLDDRSPHGPLSPAGFHLYNIHEMVSHMGKKRKMPMTLGINVPKGTIMIAPEKSRDGPQKEWTAEKMTYYSQEGKHLFMELVKPSKSIEFHCGAKDTASEIVASLGEMSGLAKAEGLREVYAAGSGTSHVQKKGQILFDFMAQGDDEVTVGIGDEVLILDDTASEEWWKVRRLKNGKVGVVPRDFVEVIETIAVSSRSGLNAGRSTVEQNRLEEDRLARQASKSHKKRDSESRAAEVGPGLALPERHSSLMQSEVDHRRTSQRGSRGNKDSPATSKPSEWIISWLSAVCSANLIEPNSAKIRTWTDRSGSFKVEAEFIGLRDGKIHLHKLNGVKIAVPVTKMAIEDLEYVERATGVSLDEDKPLADLKRKSTQRAKERNSAEPRAGITVEKPKRPEYDWFDFFLGCGVNPQICERYSAAFAKDEMGEEILPDVNESLLRTLGLKEGDILRVMKVLDKKFNRTPGEKRGVSFGDTSVINEDGEGANGGLFSGAGGALRNNTRKGRPAPPVQTNDTVDAKAFEQKTDGAVKKSAPAESTPTPLASLPAPERKGTDGFDDNAWEVKPSRQPSVSASAPPAQAATAPAPTPAAPPPTLTGSLAELSLLSPPLQPTIVAQPAPQQAPAPQSAPPQQAAPTGAVPSLFDQLANQPPVQPPQQPSFMTQQPTGFGMPPAPSQQMSMARTRPQAPQQQSQGGSLIAPPPVRAASAPQNQQSAFGPPPLQPQLTGFQGAPNMQTQVAAPGQSLQDLTLQRNFMQQQQQMQPMQTGFPQQQQGPQGFDNFQNGLMPQPTGMNQFPQQQQSMQTSFGQPQQLQFQHPQSTGFQPQFQSPFADPPTQPFQPQPTGFNSFAQPLNPQATGINMFLPPALQPQRTGFTNGFGQQQSPPPMPPMPPMPTGIGGGNGIGGGLAPLTAQKTGPAPPVRFGTQPKAKKLVPQPTGKADLSKATPMNPFGF